jgi:hypothetical protein
MISIECSPCQKLLPSWPGGPRLVNTALYNQHNPLLTQRLYKAAFVKAVISYFAHCFYESII